MTTAIRDRRTITQHLFARKREVDGWPSLRGGQEVLYPARRNTRGVGYLSALLCKACVVALKDDVTAITLLSSPGLVAVRSRSQSGPTEHTSVLAEGALWLPRGQVTYHLGLLFVAEALAAPTEATDLLDALEELLAYREEHDTTTAARYDTLLMHLADELYYWAKFKGGDPVTQPERLDRCTLRDADSPPGLPATGSLDPALLTDLAALRAHRALALAGTPLPGAPAPLNGTAFRGPQLAELVESLRLGMPCLLVGPTATGKSLCAREAFSLADPARPVHIIEGHESLREFDLLGGYTPDGGGAFAWRDGVLVAAMRDGGFLFIDEANRMPARTLNVLMGVLSRRTVLLTEHGAEEVRARDGFQVVLAMNLGQGYAVNTLDRALLDRFPCVLEFRYLPPREEEALLAAETGLDRTTASVMVNVAQETRALRRSRELAGELTPRGLLAWARKLQAKRGGTLLARLQASARVTWLHQVAGTDADGYVREDTAARLLALIEAHTPR